MITRHGPRGSVMTEFGFGYGELPTRFEKARSFDE